MTKDELFVAIYCDSTDTLLEKLKGLDDSERSTLASTAMAEHWRLIRICDAGEQKQIAKQLEKLNKELEKAGGKLESISRPTMRYWDRPLQRLMHNSILASLGCCAKSDALKVNYWRSHHFDRVTEQLFLARKPDWLGEWINKEIDQEYSSVDWQLVDFCVAKQLCPRPQIDRYIELMLSGLYATHDANIYKALEANPRLYDDELWQIFAVDNWMLKRDQNGYDSGGWPDTLLRLSDEKEGFRKKLITKLLEGLLLNLKNPVLQDFTQFYQAFALSDEERSEHEALFLAMLNSPKGFIVTFALKELQQLVKAKLLGDSDTLLNLLQPILSGSVKSQQKLVLTIAKVLSKQSLECKGRYLTLLCQGLHTPNVDIQKTLLTTLAKEQKHLKATDLSLICNAKEFIAPSLLSQYQALTPESQPSMEIASCDNDEEIAQQIAQYSPQQLAQVGLAPLLENINASLEPLQRTTQKAIHTLFTIKPIATLPELVELITRAMERSDEAEDFELILDGVSRLHQHRMENFALLTDTIRARLEKKPSEQGICSLRFGVEELNRLLLQWIIGHQNIGTDEWYRPPTKGISLFLRRRILEVKKRLELGFEMPLLALPTHQGGWLEPQALIDRFINRSH